MAWVKTDRKVYPRNWSTGTVYCRQAGNTPMHLLSSKPSGEFHGTYNTESPNSGEATCRGNNDFFWECEWVEDKRKLYVSACDIEVGRWYISPSGKTPFEVLTTKWLGSKVLCKVRDKTGTYERTLRGAYEVEETKDEEMNNTLYQIKGTETYGTLLAKNSEGKFVLEIKGTKEVKTVDPTDVEEVIPHSVAVKFNGQGQNYHYFAPKDSLEVGDWVIMDCGSFAKVTDVDCKSKKATKELMGRKVLTESFR